MEIAAPSRRQLVRAAHPRFVGEDVRTARARFIAATGREAPQHWEGGKYTED